MTDPIATADPPRWRLEPFDIEDEAPAGDPDRYGGVDGELCSGSDTLGVTADDLPALDLDQLDPEPGGIADLPYAADEAAREVDTDG